MTDVVQLKKTSRGRMSGLDTLPARLSIVRGTEGNPSLRI